MIDILFINLKSFDHNAIIFDITLHPLTKPLESLK
jgi:hypothetical protein